MELSALLMMIFTSAFLNLQPIDALTRKLCGLPKSGKAFLTLINPRPAGIALRSLNPKMTWPMDGLTDIEYEKEIRKNSGYLASILLREPLVANRFDFQLIFEDFEIEYLLAIKKISWLSIFTKSNKNQLRSLMKNTRTSLTTADQCFIKWAIKNRSAINSALKNIMTDPLYIEGNAQSDLQRRQPSWLLISSRF